MAPLRALFALVLVAACAAAPSRHSVHPQADLDALAERTLESTVRINIKSGGHGSGFFCFEPNLVCTAAHVVDPMEPLNGFEVKTYEGEICNPISILYPAEGDIAIVEVDCTGKPFKRLRSPTRGISVMAAGNPLSVEWVTSFGHITAEHHTVFGVDMFVYDAQVNPGNSGGPIVDMQGQLVGLVNAVSTRDGMWAGLGFGTDARKLEELLRR